jgi:hypothetical protein
MGKSDGQRVRTRYFTVYIDSRWAPVTPISMAGGTRAISDVMAQIYHISLRIQAHHGFSYSRSQTRCIYINAYYTV